MEFELNIGLEFHIQLKTKKKLFSNVLNRHTENENENVSLFDLGFPGVLPILNQEAIKLATKACILLNMNINKNVQFDRKHYFYSDSPKGYQITQNENPLGTNGYLQISNRKVPIIDLHVEEDTCKQIHTKGYTYLDFNRCDVPLIEVVTDASITSAKEAKEVAIVLKELLVEHKITNGRMEIGSFRVDVNISVKKAKSNELGTRVEIKNVNSFNNIEKCINYEFSRQKSLILENVPIKQEAFRYDDKLDMNVVMRDKEDDLDYRVFTDPNLPPYKLTDEYIESIKNEILLSSENYFDGLPKATSKILSENSKAKDYFLELMKLDVDKILAANFLTNEMVSICKTRKIFSPRKIVTIEQFAKLIHLIKTDKANKNDVYSLLIEQGNIEEFIKEKENCISCDENEIDELVLSTIKENPDAVNDYLNGKDKALGFLIKKTIDKTNRSINIKKVSEKIIKNIKGD